ncbi:MAG: DNA polymerase III subunit beta [bacterium]|jgi:DNA polymerase-3 subunit beta
MKVNLSTSYLEKALSVANKIIPSKTPLTVLEGVKIEATDNNLILTTTDLENEFKAYINCEVFKEGSVILPSKDFFKIISKIDYPEIQLEVEENKLIINSLGFRAELTTISEGEYPEIDFGDFNNSITLNSEEFENGINYVIYASSYPEDSNPVFAGILFEINNNNINLVATDGSQLALYSISYQSSKKLNNEEVYKLIVPVKSLNAVLKELNEEVVINFNETSISFSYDTEFGKVTINSKLIEGSFPEYKEVIPSKFKTSFSISRKPFLNAIKRVSLLSKCKELSGVIIFNIAKNKLVIESIESEIGKAKEELIISNFKGESLNVAFNSKFLEDMLNKVKEDELILSFIDSDSPLKCELSEKEGFLYLLMPVRISAVV